MPNFVLLVLFFFFTLSGVAQEEVKKDALSANGGRVIIRTTTPVAPAQADGLEQAPVTADDADIVELEKAREKQLKQIELVQRSTDPLKQPLGNPIEEIKKLGYKQLGALALLDERVVALLQQTLKEADFSQLTSDYVRQSIKEKLKGHFFEAVFESFPKLLDVTVDLFRSKDALSGLLGIFARKDDLKTYGQVWLAILVFSALVKKRIVKPKWAFLRRMRWSLSITFLLTTLSLAIFYHFFSEELAPTISIFQKHLL